MATVQNAFEIILRSRNHADKASQGIETARVTEDQLAELNAVIQRLDRALAQAVNACAGLSALIDAALNHASRVRRVEFQLRLMHLQHLNN